MEPAELDARIQELDVEGLQALGLDLEDLGLLVRDTADLLDAAPPTPTGRRRFGSDDARAAALTVALQALSAAARDVDDEGDEAATVRELCFQLAASLFGLGRRPEMVCTLCGTSYLPVGLFACPRCR